ncbi:MAG: zinc-dependent alcohol dehydrogenase family protein [Arenicellales bacterium]
MAVGTMNTMTLTRPGAPLELQSRPVPDPPPGSVLVAVSACGVCRTDLHLIDGELPDIPYPIVPGHEVVGRVLAAGEGVDLPAGRRVGIPWLGRTCGHCRYCLHDQENLCDEARFTGYQIDGGYATHALADARYCFEIPERYDDAHAAPLLCAGLIGYRSLRMAGSGVERLGIYGFGAAAHVIAQVAVHRGIEIYAFSRPGDEAAQRFARELGAVWSGGSDTAPDVELDAAIIFAPVGALVPAALKTVRKGGTVVCGGIHMSDIPSFAYRDLWGERHIRSVANLTRRDAREFLEVAGEVPIETEVRTYSLSEANQALDDLRHGRFQGAAVLIPRGFS